MLSLGKGPSINDVNIKRGATKVMTIGKNLMAKWGKKGRVPKKLEHRDDVIYG